MKYPLHEVERMIAEARQQKQAMEDLVGDLERKPRFDKDDLKYVDGVLKGIEGRLRALRKQCRRPVDFI
jgi:hypothetical protein